MNRRLTDLQLERYLTEALAPEQRREVESVLASSPDDAAALADLRAENEAFLVRSPAPAFAARVVRERPKRRGLQAWFALAAVMATAGVVVLVGVNQPEEGLHAKGAVAWGVTVTHQGQTRTLESGMVVFADDVLSFQVTAAEATHVAVLSQDTNGLFAYVPSSGVKAVRVGPGVTLLPEGAKLDAILGNEELLLLSAPHSFGVEAAQKALAEEPGLTTWGEVAVSRIRFEKRATP